MVLLPQHSADGRAVYDWSFLALLMVLASVAVGTVSGIGRVLEGH
jgi:hypothetical protein